METRLVRSNVWGDLGTFKRVRRPEAVFGRVPLYASDSGRVYILGNGNLGGKSEGLLFLDRICDSMRFHVPEMNLAVCDDYFGLPDQPVLDPRSLGGGGY